VREQISDIMPSLLLALAISGSVYSLSLLLDIHHTLLLLIQTGVLLALWVVLSKGLKLKGYIEIRNIIIEKVPQLKHIL